MNEPSATSKNRWVTTNLTDTKKVWFIIYLSVVSIIGLCLACFVLKNNNLPEPHTVAMFIVFGIVGFNYEIRLPSKAKIHATWPLLVAALYCHGLPLAMLAGVTGMISQFIFGSSAFLNALFNGGQLALSLVLAQLTGKVALRLGPKASQAYEVVALILGMMVFDVCNIALVSLAVSINEQISWQNCFINMFYRDRRSFLPLLYLLTLAGALLCSFIGNIGLLIIFAHVLAVWHLMRFQQELDVSMEQARTDPLTKAFNYRYLENWLRNEFPKLLEHDAPCSFIFADLDGLKNINDTYGHEAGDTVLRQVAQILFSVAEKNDLVIRYGGDEFIMICPATDVDTAAVIGTNIIEILDRPICYQGSTFKIGLSIGIASYPKDSNVGRNLVRLADWAMYHAKKDGGNRVCKVSDL